jgi:hypothetical protein
MAAILYAAAISGLTYVAAVETHSRLRTRRVRAARRRDGVR